MKPIVTLTLNPAIDVACQADEVHPIHKIRTSHERYAPGGRGINVARVIRALGGEALAVYCAGGLTGQAFDQMVEWGSSSAGAPMCCACTSRSAPSRCRSWPSRGVVKRFDRCRQDHEAAP